MHSGHSAGEVTDLSAVTYGHEMDQRWQQLSDPETQAELSHEKGRCGRGPYSPASQLGQVPTTTGERGSPRSWGVSGQDWGWGGDWSWGGVLSGGLCRGVPPMSVCRSPGPWGRLPTRRATAQGGD